MKVIDSWHISTVIFKAQVIQLKTREAMNPNYVDGKSNDGRIKN